MRRGKRGNSRWRRKREGDAKKESREGTWRAMGRAEIRIGRIEKEIGRVEWAEKGIGRIEWVEREIGRVEWVALVVLIAFEAFQPLLAAVAVPFEPLIALTALAE